MAFNFNWSPLIADTERVRDMLTNALNKSPKPPIIVDDIIVNELNLGSTPPELEILEIGDLAEDRFRGIFKMSYTGDAYLTLKTRVQANPLNTYLSTRPAFASPQPLAANSSLTIPIHITLSEFRLSGFVILVFSKQKGITIVFRNDPLEQLKVSSTFDSIPFVRDYLQKTIEKQLRVLFIEDLPAIIHRLSLRMFSPEHQPSPHSESTKPALDDDQPIDTFSDSQTLEAAIDSHDNTAETYASFSQKSLLRLAALTDSQKTLSLFTPSIRDTVYRAWTSAAQREDAATRASTPVVRPVSLSKLKSALGTPTMLSSAASQTSDSMSQVTRPSMTSLASTTTVYNMASGPPKTRPGKKRKHRVVNLRKSRESEEIIDTASIASSYDESASRSVTGSTESAIPKASTGPTTAPTVRSRDIENAMSPRSPKGKEAVYSHTQEASAASNQHAMHRPTTPNVALQAPLPSKDLDPTPRAPDVMKSNGKNRPTIQNFRSMQPFQSRSPSPELRRSSSDRSRMSADRKLQNLLSGWAEGSSGGILEQAWLQKMAGEIARKVADEESRRPSWEPSSFDGMAEGTEAPPAYGS